MVVLIVCHLVSVSLLVSRRDLHCGVQVVETDKSTVVTTFDFLFFDDDEDVCDVTSATAEKPVLQRLNKSKALSFALFTSSADIRFVTSSPYNIIIAFLWISIRFLSISLYLNLYHFTLCALNRDVCSRTFCSSTLTSTWSCLLYLIIWSTFACSLTSDVFAVLMCLSMTFSWEVGRSPI